ncbi:MAG: TetR/AcrR family transcriptional regulator [Spirochaetes bacterium]|nr:TetR/AcrR family transcriptional regulator [Spirochaetota bacterium]
MTADHRSKIETRPGEPEKVPTGERLERAAIQLFSTHWYATVSVAEICREAGVSNGLFYRYYRNKEELFRKLLGEILASIESELRELSGSSRHGRLSNFVDRLSAYTEAHPDLIAIFREGQYRFFDYERALMEIYRRALSAALGRDCSLADYLFALGGIRFTNIRRSLQGTPLDPGVVVNVLENGAFPGLTFDVAKVFEIEVRPPVIVAAPAARERLLQAGKRLFGERGYHEANIHEITDAAGLSVGSFYLWFPSKECFYAELIGLVGREVRHFITSNLLPGLNRLEREMQGIWLFSIFLSIDRYCYNIVREAEFVLPDKVKEYYDAFERGYRHGTDAIEGPDAPTRINFLLGVSHYFGIEIVFDHSPENARALIEGIGQKLAGGFSSGKAAGLSEDGRFAERDQPHGGA